MLTELSLSLLIRDRGISRIFRGYLRERTRLWAANDTTLDPIIQTRDVPYKRASRKKKKKRGGKEKNSPSAYFIAALSVSTLCLYISKFDIDSPGIGQTLFLWRRRRRRWKKKKEREREKRYRADE